MQRRRIFPTVCKIKTKELIIKISNVSIEENLIHEVIICFTFLLLETLYCTNDNMIPSCLSIRDVLNHLILLKTTHKKQHRVTITTGDSMRFTLTGYLT